MAKILLIDDDDSVRTMLRLMLTQFGHTVIEARNGREGLNLFQDANADLVITDLVMPETEGFEVLTKLREKLPRVKIIVISGGVKGNVTNYLDMARRLGAGQVLAKPFSNNELMTAINELLPAAETPAPPV